MAVLEPRIYLASNSPRRRELLKQIGVNFEVLQFRAYPISDTDVSEDPLPDETTVTYVERVCKAKAMAGWERILERRLPKYAVLSADTTVCLDDKVIGKPQNREHAMEILKKLSGKTHQVLTAVSVKFDSKLELKISETLVQFRPLEEMELKNYIATGEPMDKAGAYAIQGRAASFIVSINGSYSGVMGLPLYETAMLLRKFGYPL